MLGNDDAGDENRRRAARLSLAFAGLVALTFGLIVLGALVRAHGAGLACPDWPLCFGEFVPEMDLKVAFEWTHRALVGGMSLGFAGLAWLTLRDRFTRDACGQLIALATLLLAVQILLGALTVWKLLAAWSVTSHLLTGNAFALTLLMIACRLREAALDPRARGPAVSRALRVALATTAALLLLQFFLGGLVSSRYAGLACPEWPACNGGVWFPSWRGTVGLHLLHRMNGYALLTSLAACAWLGRLEPGLRALTAGAFTLGLAQMLVGIANVLTGLPVEVTGLHSALAAALAITLTLAIRAAVLASAPGARAA